MERYNSSPEPTINYSNEYLNNCYKTPDFSHYQYASLGQPSLINQAFPTPPSDNDENSNSILENSLRTSKTDSQAFTPTLNSENYQYKTVYQNQSKQEAKPVNEIQKTSSNSTAPTKYKRRSRTTYTKSQLDMLEATFQKTPYPEIRMVDDLSQMLNLSTEKISIWFQNRRARSKKARKLENQENRFVEPVPYSYDHMYNYPQSNAYLSPGMQDNSKLNPAFINNESVQNKQFNSYQMPDNSYNSYYQASNLQFYPHASHLNIDQSFYQNMTNNNSYAYPYQDYNNIKQDYSKTTINSTN